MSVDAGDRDLRRHEQDFARGAACRRHPSLPAIWLILFMICIRDLPMSPGLSPAGTPGLAFVTFDIRLSGELGPLSAASVMIMGFVSGVVGVARGDLDRATRL